MKTIDITPTWGSLIPLLVEVAANGETHESRKHAMNELIRLATIVDDLIESNRIGKP